MSEDMKERPRSPLEVEWLWGPHGASPASHYPSPLTGGDTMCEVEASLMHRGRKISIPHCDMLMISAVHWGNQAHGPIGHHKPSQYSTRHRIYAESSQYQLSTASEPDRDEETEPRDRPSGLRDRHLGMPKGILLPGNPGSNQFPLPLLIHFTTTGNDVAWHAFKATLEAILCGTKLSICPPEAHEQHIRSDRCAMLLIAGLRISAPSQPEIATSHWLHL